MKRRRIFWGKSLAIVRISCYNKNNSTFQKRGMTLDILDMIAAAPRVFMSITIPDVIDIILLTLLLIAVIRFMSETRATQLLKGIGLIALLYLLVGLGQALGG